MSLESIKQNYPLSDEEVKAFVLGENRPSSDFLATRKEEMLFYKTSVLTKRDLA